MIPAVNRSQQPSTELKPDVQKRKLKEACQEFESLLTGYVFKSMRQSMDKAEDSDQATQIYESMMDDTLARELSRSGNGGLADMLYRELLPLVETPSIENLPHVETPSVENLPLVETSSVEKRPAAAGAQGETES